MGNAIEEAVQVAAGMGGHEYVWRELTIAVPAYARPDELAQLLRSVEGLEVMPGEVLICEDASGDRERIRQIVRASTPRLATRGCKLTYVENDENLGYDGNLRKLFRESAGDWVMLIGNDDLVLPRAVASIRDFVLMNSDISMISGAYLKFRGDPEKFFGWCRWSAKDCICDRASATAGAVVRLSGFVGGLVFRRDFAVGASTEEYDGSLYYQMYLAALAYCGRGIGYIATPIVASRAGNAPLFGAASAERAVHRPGSYSAAARLAMWQGILRIFTDAERKTGVPLVLSVRRELARRQSLHVFELVSVQGRHETVMLIRGLWHMKLMKGLVIWSVALASVALGRHVSKGFWLARAAQRVWSRVHVDLLPYRVG